MGVLLNNLTIFGLLFKLIYISLNLLKQINLKCKAKFIFFFFLSDELRTEKSVQLTPNLTSFVYLGGAHDLFRFYL